MCCDNRRPTPTNDIGLSINGSQRRNEKASELLNIVINKKNKMTIDASDQIMEKNNTTPVKTDQSTTGLLGKAITTLTVLVTVLVLVSVLVMIITLEPVLIQVPRSAQANPIRTT